MEQKYSSRAAELYKAHLSKLVADKILMDANALEPPPPTDTVAAVGCGLDNLMLSYQEPEDVPVGGAGSSDGEGLAPISREETTLSPPTASDAASEQEAEKSFAVAVICAPEKQPPARVALQQDSQRSPTGTFNTLTRGAGELKLSTATGGGSTIVTEAGGGADLVVGGVSGTGSGVFKTGPRKSTVKGLGARKLGARKMGTEGPGASSGMASFEEAARQATEAQAAAKQAAQDREQAEKDRKARELNAFLGHTPRSGTTMQDWAAPLPASPVVQEYRLAVTREETGPSVSTGPLAAKFSTAKGIGSDQLFGNDEETADIRHERQTKLAGLHGARAISSDMYFGDGQDRDCARGSYAGGPDVDELAAQAAERLRSVGQNVARGVGLLKDASSNFFESFRA